MYNYREEVYKLVKRVPKGKVATYGEIARIVGINPRMVGWALHSNKDSKNVPCHRVVNKNGRLAPNYAFGGSDEQRKKLESEGVVFKDRMHANLVESLWKT